MKLVVLIAACLQLVQGHSWIDCLATDKTFVTPQPNGMGSHYWIYGGSKANGYCPGYASAYPGRGNSRINRLFTNKLRRDDVDHGIDVCQNLPFTPYEGWRHRLEVHPGQKVYFAYMPNGHIAKDRWARGTKHGVYWTGVPDQPITSTSQLTYDKLIDGQLKEFDDGTCGETYTDNHRTHKSGRAGDGIPCVADFTVPNHVHPGRYYLVWLWKFYNDDGTPPGDDPSRARGYYGMGYTSCLEIIVK